MKSVRNDKTKKMVMAALFAALACVATYMVKIPTPTKGYFNLGDCIVLLAGFLLGPVYGGAAAGIGSMLADVFAGYMVYAPATFVIKALVAITAVLVFRAMGKTKPGLIVGGFVGETIMVLGYFIFECFMMLAEPGADGGFYAASIAAAAGIPMNILQGVVGIAVSSVLYFVLKDRIK